MKLQDMFHQCKTVIFYLSDKDILDSGVSIEAVGRNELIVELGTRSCTEHDLEWTKDDLPMVQAHEEAHIWIMQHRLNEAIYNKAFRQMTPEERLMQISEEISAWKLAMWDVDLTPDMIEKIQAMINTYVFKHYKLMEE